MAVSKHGSERALWSTYSDAFRPFGHLQRIENLAGSGQPDINQCISSVESWVELKHAAQWPANKTAPLLLPHYTPQQRNWHRARHAAGGRVYVLLQVGAEYLLFAGVVAAQWLGRATRAELYSRAVVWEPGGGFPAQALLAEFTSRTPYKSTV